MPRPQPQPQLRPVANRVCIPSYCCIGVVNHVTARVRRCRLMMRLVMGQSQLLRACSPGLPLCRVCMHWVVNAVVNTCNWTVPVSCLNPAVLFSVRGECGFQWPTVAVCHLTARHRPRGIWWLPATHCSDHSNFSVVRAKGSILPIERWSSLSSWLSRRAFYCRHCPCVYCVYACVYGSMRVNGVCVCVRVWVSGSMCVVCVRACVLCVWTPNRG